MLGDHSTMVVNDPGLSIELFESTSSKNLICIVFFVYFIAFGRIAFAEC